MRKHARCRQAGARAYDLEAFNPVDDNFDDERGLVGVASMLTGSLLQIAKALDRKEAGYHER